MPSSGKFHSATSPLTARVINAQGKISLGRTYLDGDLHQHHLLEAEGVEFDANGTIALKRFRWQPSQPRGAWMCASYNGREMGCKILGYSESLVIP